MTTATYTVTGMTCGHCVGSVTEQVRDIAGVTAVAVDLPTGGLIVTSAGAIPPAFVDAAVISTDGRAPHVTSRNFVSVPAAMPAKQSGIAAPAMSVSHNWPKENRPGSSR